MTSGCHKNDQDWCVPCPVLHPQTRSISAATPNVATCNGADTIQGEVPPAAVARGRWGRVQSHCGPRRQWAFITACWWPAFAPTSASPISSLACGTTLECFETATSSRLPRPGRQDRCPRPGPADLCGAHALWRRRACAAAGGAQGGRRPARHFRFKQDVEATAGRPARGKQLAQQRQPGRHLPSPRPACSSPAAAPPLDGAAGHRRQVDPPCRRTDTGPGQLRLVLGDDQLRSAAEELRASGW